MAVIYAYRNKHTNQTIFLDAPSTAFEVSPDWDTFTGGGSGGGSGSGGQIVNNVTASANAAGGSMVLVNAGIGPVTITLPAPSVGLAPISVLKIGSDANAVTVRAINGATINGHATAVVDVPYTGGTYVTDGISYYERR